MKVIEIYRRLKVKKAVRDFEPIRSPAILYKCPVCSSDLPVWMVGLKYCYRCGQRVEF